jgi:predicted SprT family Zn-dependent metalloprotease
MTRHEAQAVVNNLLNKIPMEEREKFCPLKVYFDDSTIELDDNGGFVKGRYYDGSEIVIYVHYIIDEEELKEVFKHELAHHFGMGEKEIRKYINRGYFGK